MSGSAIAQPASPPQSGIALPPAAEAPADRDPPAADSAESAAAPPAALLLPAQLTLDDAMRIFRQQGLDLLIADAAVQSARADLRMAAALPNPTLSGSVSKSFHYNPNDPSQCPDGGCADLGFSVGVADSALWDALTGKRGLRIKTARAALSAARLSRRDAERTIGFQLRQQLVQVAAAQRVVDFSAEVQQAATQTAELNKRRYQVGAISEVDLAKAETDLLQAEQALDSARSSLRTERLALAFLLGVRGLVPDFTVQFDLGHGDQLATLQLPERQGLLENALAHRPDLAAQAAEQARAEAGLEAARRQRVPDLSLNLQYAQQGTGQNAITPQTLTFGAQLVLPVFYQNQGGVAKGLADLRQQTLQLARLQAQVVTDVESSHNALTLNRQLIRRLETGLLDRARRTRDLQQLRYQKGAASLLEYLDAQRTYISTNQDYIQSLANYWTARFQLEQALGL